MTEGHPCFVANNGRLGFGVDEYRAYAPEAAAGTTLVRPAARRDHATFTAGTGLDYPGLIADELGEETPGRFAARMTGLGLDLDDYLLVPDLSDISTKRATPHEIPARYRADFLHSEPDPRNIDECSNAAPRMTTSSTTSYAPPRSSAARRPG